MVREYGPKRDWPNKTVMRFRYYRSGNGYRAEKEPVHLVRSTTTRPTYYWVNANPRKRGGGGGNGAKLSAINKAVWGKIRSGGSVSASDLTAYGYNPNRQRGDPSQAFAAMAAARAHWYREKGIIPKPVAYSERRTSKKHVRQNTPHYKFDWRGLGWGEEVEDEPTPPPQPPRPIDPFDWRAREWGREVEAPNNSPRPNPPLPTRPIDPFDWRAREWDREVEEPNNSPRPTPPPQYQPFDWRGRGWDKEVE